MEYECKIKVPKLQISVFFLVPVIEILAQGDPKPYILIGVSGPNQLDLLSWEEVAVRPTL